MAISFYTHRQIAEYEALAHRIANVAEFLQSEHGAEPSLIEHAADVLAYRHYLRVGRLQSQLSYDLRHHQGILKQINQYNNANLQRLFNIRPHHSDLDELSLSFTSQHFSEDEINHASLIILSIVNLKAMSQLNAEIISRDPEDPVSRGYQHAICSLLHDTEHSHLERKYTPVKPKRVRTLGLEPLEVLADQATQQARDLANPHKPCDIAHDSTLTTTENQHANSTRHRDAYTGFPIRLPTDSQLAATCDGARVFTAAVHKQGMKWLAAGDQTTAIVNAARNAGVNETAINELCHRIHVKPDLQESLEVPQNFHVNRDDATHVVNLILALGPLSFNAAETAAREMGWTTELLIGTDND